MPLNEDVDKELFHNRCNGPHCTHEFDPVVALRDVKRAAEYGETPYIEYVVEAGEGAGSYTFCSVLCFQQWLNEEDIDETRPRSWPESYSAFGRDPECDHHMQWDLATSVYRCIHDCGEIDEHPPEDKIET